MQLAAAHIGGVHPSSHVYSWSSTPHTVWPALPKGSFFLLICVPRGVKLALELSPAHGRTVGRDQGGGAFTFVPGLGGRAAITSSGSSSGGKEDQDGSSSSSDHEDGSMELVLSDLKGRNVLGVDKDGTSDPYLSITAGKHKIKTKVPLPRTCTQRCVCISSILAMKTAQEQHCEPTMG